MSNNRIGTDLGTEDAALEANVERWRQMIHEMPDLRLEKVNTARQTLQRDGYEEEQVLEETLRRVCEEVVAPLRTQPHSK